MTTTRITLDLTTHEIDALIEDVAFDAGLNDNFGGHPASESLLLKIEQALKDVDLTDLYSLPLWASEDATSSRATP